MLRGFVDNELTKTTAKTQTIFGEKANVEISIDPEKFQKFHIDVVPAVVITESEKTGLEKESTNDNAVPQFDVIYGDASLEEALKRLEKSGSPESQKAANHYLKKYRDSHE